MDVRLMTDVKNKMILRRIENDMQGQSQFDHTQIGAKMTPRFRQHCNHSLADFLRELL